MMKKKHDPEVIFANIKEDNQPTVIESLCTNCQKNGNTTLLLTKIPFFRQIIISSFFCDQCGFRNNEVQFGGKLPDFGVHILFRVMSKADLNRELIKSEHAVIHFEEIDLEIPANGKAEINTIQGFLLRMYDELKFHQPLRKIHEPESYEKLEIFFDQVKMYLDGQKFPLTVKVRDPSGNSNIKNPFAPKQDKNCQITHFERTMEELTQMGYSQQNAEEEKKNIESKKLCQKINFTKPFQENNFMHNEAAVFNVPCFACSMMGETRMCEISVPYFTDLIIMSFRCEYCGAHSAETKGCGEVKENASIITLNIEGDADLKRDLFKSDTCAINLPDIQLELGFGSLGGVFTTVEGLLEKISDTFEENNPFADSDKELSNKVAVLLSDLQDMREGKRKFTLILTDPLSHSFIANPFHPSEDPRLKVQFRPRTFDENEELGLNDIKVDNYQKNTETEPEKKE